MAFNAADNCEFDTLFRGDVDEDDELNEAGVDEPDDPLKLNAFVFNANGLNLAANGLNDGVCCCCCCCCI